MINSSIIVTTYKTDTYYTQACLESIRKWKQNYHELIVVVHDETPLMRTYLESCVETQLIDKLIFTVHNHGHTKSFNLGYKTAKNEIIFNIANDICIGPLLIDDCSNKLLDDNRIGLIGWFWYANGVYWKNDQISQYQLRDNKNPNMGKNEENKLRNSKYFTGKTFKSLNGPKWIHLCNTGFFGARKETLNKIGGGFSPEFHHYWADDFLNYLILDQGYDIAVFNKDLKKEPYFLEFQYKNIDTEDRHRHEDKLINNSNALLKANQLGGGMSSEEYIMLYYLALSIKNKSPVINMGTWRGASSILLLDALKDKEIDFYFYDCFDIPKISSLSNQPPVPQQEFLNNIKPFINDKKHKINIIKTNTLDISSLPAFDFVFVDAGHTPECIKNDINLIKRSAKDNSVLVFHDYGQPAWPSVKPIIDQEFPNIEFYKTLAIKRNAISNREEYFWV